MLRSILQNLVANAIKFTPQGGSVVINAKPDEQMVWVFVEDTGVGIADEVKAKLFKTASNGSIHGTNNETGNGLGLLLVNDFVVQHGGTIDVQSSVGTGTIFKFTIPVVKLA
jgi:signal transduction histidine kinase